MAVYGIGENKCLKEVAEKTDVYTKDNFIRITKTISNVPANEQNSFVMTANELEVDDVSNLMLISHMVLDTLYRFPYTHAGASLNGGNFIFIDDESNRVRVYYENYGSAVATVTIRLVFLKVE